MSEFCILCGEAMSTSVCEQCGVKSESMDLFELDRYQVENNHPVAVCKAGTNTLVSALMTAEAAAHVRKLLQNEPLGSVSLTAAGYAEDLREIWQVPEIRAWAVSVFSGNVRAFQALNDSFAASNCGKICWATVLAGVSIVLYQAKGRLWVRGPNLPEDSAVPLLSIMDWCGAGAGMAVLDSMAQHEQSRRLAEELKAELGE